MRDLRPIPFAAHLRRLIPEMTRHGACYDLPERVWHRPSRRSGAAFHTSFHGHPAGSPVGPAAGPHTQMAQNIVLAYVAGARIFELKTIQIMDRLKIPRPCIDVRNIGFNVEWSQELRIEESLYEYAAGAYLVNIIRGENLLGCPDPLEPADDPVIWDISVGYDLAGIQSRRVSDFLRAMGNATEVLDRLDREMPPEFSHFRKYRPEARLSDTVTLSTFHGCPPQEIESIAAFMLEEARLHTIVKMNPTMLGREEVEHLLREKLGYAHLETNPHAYEVGLMFGDSVPMMERLATKARARGLGLTAKFSNTLETINKEHVLPASEKVMYLSGAPLHVITSLLAAKWREAANWMEPLSFSAGVDQTNYADVVANGCVPVSTCTDLLKPGGYGRLSAYASELEKAMQAVGAATVPQFIRRRAGAAGVVCGEFAAAGVTINPEQAARFLETAERAEVPLRRAVMCPEAPGKQTYETLRDGAGTPAMREAMLAILDRVTRRAAGANWTKYAAAVREDDRYAFARNNRAPKKIKSHLALYDCINCDKCIPVCPNDAMFAYTLKPTVAPKQAIRYTPGAGFHVSAIEGEFRVEKDHQLANFADWCNECSNCMTYCPEQGGPFIEKPRFFSDRVGFMAATEDGFVIERIGGIAHALARIGGALYELEWRRAESRATLRDEYIIAEFDTTTHEVLETFLSQGLPAERTLNTEIYHILRTMIEGMLDSPQPNPVNAGCGAG